MVDKAFHRQQFSIVIVILALILTACSSPQATPAHLTTVGIVNYVGALSPVIDAFKAGMSDLGYVDGKNVTYLYDGIVATNNDAVDQEIQSLLKRNTDVFLALGTLPSDRLKVALQGTNKAAIFAPVVNPVELGLVADLHKPGGRLTGIDSGGPLIEKGMEWLLTVVPTIKRIHAPYRQDDPNAAAQLPSLQAAATKLKVDLIPEKVTTVDQAFSLMPSYTKGTDAVFVVPALFIDPTVSTKYMDAAIQQGIPVGSSYSTAMISDGLTSVSTDYGKIGKQAARLVQEVVQGTDPGTIPVESAEFTFDINLVTAHALGLTVSDTVLQQANNILRDTGGTATPAR